jgi:parvulin-like peptidyl-prolyl isomerase
MKYLGIALFVCLAPLRAQSLPNLSDETVVATFADGAKMTMGEFKRLYAVIPPELQKLAVQNRQAFLEQWSLMRKLARMAEDDKLDQLSPVKEALEYNRLAILSQAKMDDAALHTTVLPSQVAEYYEQHRDRYRQVRVKAIYIGFGGRRLTAADAKAKASRIAAQARAGADFVKLVRENSDDETSRAKDGEFLTLRGNDNVPDAVRDAIFALHQGEVSEPVAQSNGYYIFRVEEIAFRPLEDVRDEIFTEVKQQRYAEWVDKTRHGDNVQYNSMDFIGAVPLNTVPKK